MQRKTLVNILFGLIAAAVIAYFYPHPEANQYKFEEGRPWNYAKLIAPFDIPIRPDSGTVRQIRDSLDSRFLPVFERNPEAINHIITSLMGQWAASADAADEGLRKKAVAYLRQAFTTDVIDDDYGLRIANGDLHSIRIVLNNTVHTNTTKGISYIAEVLQDMPRAISPLDTAAGRRWMEENEIAEALQPNLVYSKITNQRLYQSELDRFTGNRGVIQQGQMIIDKGSIISPQDFTNLLTYEEMVSQHLTHNRRSIWIMWLGQLLYTLIIIGTLLAFLRFSSTKTWNSRKSMFFILTLITVMFVVGILVGNTINNGVYMVPFMIVPVLLIVFFDAPTALFSVLALILISAGAVSLPLEFIVVQVSAAVAAVYSLRELTQRSQLLRTSLFVLGAYLLSYVAVELMVNGSTAGMQLSMFIYLAISAVLSSMAYILMVPIERAFGLVSVVTLIELSDVNNPLLRELSQQCPGTFQHSMAVSNLASDAAMRIGANEQLVRVGALYHDIGKMSNPNFFTENQQGVNPHDALPIESSAKIIIGHITDGLARADKAGLPSVIKDFISQHHGRGQAKYFYYTYCQQHPGEDVDPEPFTYPGPNPQTREASILMMADSVEAASRSLKEHSPQAIAALVNKIIDGQIADGLHNESSLRFSDVDTIKQAFIRRLMTIYHNRIVYPEDPNTKDADR